MAAPTSHGNTLRAIGVVALTFACGLGYANVLDAGFVYDDLVNIVQRATLRWGELSFANWFAAVADSPSKRPIALATFGLQYWSGFESARAFHVVNIAIHLANGLLVWRLAVVLLRRGFACGDKESRKVDSGTLEAAGLLAALLFVSHPIQTQSVTYVVQRMNSLAATFQLVALLMYIAGRGSPDLRRRVGLFAAAVLAWVAGLGSKESAAIAPITIWLYEFFFERRLSRDFARQSGAGLLLIGLPTAIAGFVVLAMSGYDPLATYPEKEFSPLERLMSQPRVLFFYASEILFPLPSRMSLLHSFEVSRSPLTPWTTLPAAIGVLAAIAGCARAAARHRLLAFCGLWFFVHLAIESTVVPLALAMEHRLYLPLVGPCVAVAYIAASGLASARWSRGRVVTAGLLVVSLLLVGTHVRNRAWASPETLWRDVLEKYPEDFTAQLNLGFHLGGVGRHDEALVEYQRALELAPDDSRVLTNIGSTLASLGRRDESIAALERALELDPENPIAPGALGANLMRQGRTSEAIVVFQQWVRRFGHVEGWLMLARAQLTDGQYTASRASFRQAGRGAPTSADPEVGLGLVAQRLGQLDRAVGHFERAVLLGPSAENHAHLGQSLWPDRDPGRAIEQLELALAAAPSWGVAQNNLAWMLATAADPALRDGERAVLLAQRVVEASGGTDVEGISTLSAGLAAMGRFDDAVRVAESGIELARAGGQESLAANLAKREARYRGGVLVLEGEAPQ